MQPNRRPGGQKNGTHAGTEEVQNGQNLKCVWRVVGEGDWRRGAGKRKLEKLGEWGV